MAEQNQLVDYALGLLQAIAIVGVAGLGFVIAVGIVGAVVGLL